MATKTKTRAAEDCEPEQEEVEVEPRAGLPGSDYGYGPPVTEGLDPGQNNSPAGATGVTVSGTSGAAAGATGVLVSVPGGSPTWESGQIGPAMTLASISPTGGTRNSGDLSLTCTGTNYTDKAYIVFDGKPLIPTTLISATQVRGTVINGASAGNTAGAKNVVVYNGPTATAPQTFTFT